ncbi:MAG: GNAT family N-acetyltransferase [Melioribacteraceae bacterium]|nr:GNAT family N-acetyltransferase [Melioribacteraceae bacterium]
MKIIPKLKSERITLRAFTLDDAKKVQKLAGDKKIAETTLYIPHPYPDGAAEEWIITHQKECEENKSIIWAITKNDNNELVGAIGFTLQPKFNKAEFGLWIGVPFWNKGYASEALSVILKYGFEELKLNKIFAHHFITNPASGKVMLKNGMKLEGHLREDVVKDGKYIDVKFYSILQREYKKLKK